jgi:hypothetical protein
LAGGADPVAGGGVPIASEAVLRGVAGFPLAGGADPIAGGGVPVASEVVHLAVGGVM